MPPAADGTAVPGTARLPPPPALARTAPTCRPTSHDSTSSAFPPEQAGHPAALGQCQARPDTGEISTGTVPPASVARLAATGFPALCSVAEETAMATGPGHGCQTAARMIAKAIVPPRPAPTSLIRQSTALHQPLTPAVKDL